MRRLAGELARPMRERRDGLENRLYRESGFLREICGENPRDCRTITGDWSMTKRGRSRTIREIRLGLGETRTQSPGRGSSRPIPGALGGALQARH